MIVSIAIAVLPVPRSPMISSRWPRPIGIMASMALSTRLQRLFHRLADDDAGRFRLDFARVLGVDRAGAVDRIAERIDDAAEHLGSDGHLEHAARAANFVAFLQLELVAEDDGANVVFFEVERERGDLLAGFGRGDLEHLAGHRLVSP